MLLNKSSAVAVYSTIPLMIAVSGGIVSPFLFNSGWKLGLGAGYVLFLLIWHRRLVQSGAVLNLLRRRILCWAFVPVLFNNFELALFSLSARYLDISVVAVIYELYHAGVIGLMAYLFRHEGRHLRVTFSTVFLMLLGMVGVGFVVFAQTGTFGSLGEAGAGALLWGLGLSGASVAAAACAAFAFRWGSDLGDELVGLGLAERGSGSDVFCVVAVTIVANAVSIPLNLVLGFVLGEAPVSGAVLWTLGLAALGGLFLNSAPSVFWRKANLMARNLGVNALGYVTPVGSLLWLLAFGFVGVSEWRYLVVGTGLLVMVNVLINLGSGARMFSGRGS